MRQRVAAAEPPALAIWLFAPAFLAELPNGRRRRQKPVAPVFSQASCNRRPAVRPVLSTSATATATPGVASASSSAARADASLGART